MEHGGGTLIEPVRKSFVLGLFFSTRWSVTGNEGGSVSNKPYLLYAVGRTTSGRLLLFLVLLVLLLLQLC